MFDILVDFLFNLSIFCCLAFVIICFISTLFICLYYLITYILEKVRERRKKIMNLK